MHKKRHIPPIFIILPIVILLLALVSFPIAKVSITKNQASAIKDSLSCFLDCVKEKDSAGADKALTDICEKTDVLHNSLNEGFWKIAAKVPFVEKELKVADELLEIVYDAENNLLIPLLEIMKEYPLTNLKVNDGFNVRLMNVYLDFLEEKQPYLETLLNTIDSINTNSIIGNYLSEKKEAIYELVDAYHEASSLLPLIRVIIGNGEDRLYLLAAQNSAEIRASGGFPGSIGTIQIKDGIMTIGDFKSVYSVLSNFSSNNSNIMDEDYIFGTWIDAPRDACFIPDFRKVGQIWSVGYQDYKVDHPEESSEEWNYENPDAWIKNDNIFYHKFLSNIVIDHVFTVGDPMEETPSDNEQNYVLTEAEAFPVGYRIYHDKSEYAPYPVNGVISLTPAIIQMLLEDIGEIELSDGTRLNGSNATKVLQYDLYYKYFNNSSDTDLGNEIADQLFAETAKIVMKEFISNFEISKFADYYKLFKTGTERNIINIWMADEAEEEIIETAGASGKLNDDPQHPVTGIYLSLADASKLGWFVDILPEISEPVINNDGSRTYDVSVTLNNVMTDTELENGSWYIIGGYGGAIRCFVHCFAPAGGTITDIETSNGMYILEDVYHDLQVAYNLDVLIERNDPIVITYKITTAPGVETPLRAVTTPTLTQYRLP